MTYSSIRFVMAARPADVQVVVGLRGSGVQGPPVELPEPPQSADEFARSSEVAWRNRSDLRGGATKFARRVGTRSETRRGPQQRLCDDRSVTGRGRAVIALVAAAVAYSAVVRPWLRRSGASHDEVESVLPGDDLVPDRYRTTHAVTIAGPPDDVWPWLVQMGYRRGGWYSYDRLERAMGAGDFAEGGSAQRIIPQLQELGVGDTVQLSPAGGLTVVGLDSPRSLVLHYRMDLLTAAAASERSRAILDWTWAFVLKPTEAGCRFLVRVRANPQPSWFGLLLPALEPVHFLMERKMLQTIKERAEVSN